MEEDGRNEGAGGGGEMKRSTHHILLISIQENFWARGLSREEYERARNALQSLSEAYVVDKETKGAAQESILSAVADLFEERP